MDLSKQHQTQFGAEDGNCFAACVASLLKVPLAEVPNFCWDHPPGEDWLEFAAGWLKPRGFSIVICSEGGQIAIPPGTLFIAGGESPRHPGHMHAVICRYEGLDEREQSRFVMVHDPHPSGEGLVGPIQDVCFLVLQP